jgi:hypothetical protein
MTDEMDDVVISSRDLNVMVNKYKSDKIHEYNKIFNQFTRDCYVKVIKAAEEGHTHVFCYVDREYDIDYVQVKVRFRRVFVNCDIDVLMRTEEFVDCVQISW